MFKRVLLVSALAVAGQLYAKDKSAPLTAPSATPAVAPATPTPDAAKPAPPQTLPLTKTGMKALERISEEYTVVRGELRELLNSELKLQGLDAKEWQLDPEHGVLFHVVPAAKTANAKK